MSDALIRPVILAGGAGTRLWPLSTAAAPKHLLPLLGETTLLEETLRRVGSGLFAPPMIVANAVQEAAVRPYLDARPGAQLLLEPVKRDSGPAIALAALAADAEELLLVCPSDQHVGDVPAFHTAIGTARPAAADGAIVTFGIKPDHPATGFGYIAAAATGDGPLPVERFVEKPAVERAEAMLAAGGHYWNAGIFLAKASTWRDAFARHAPAMLDAAAAALAEARHEGTVTFVDATAFARSPAQSVDYAVMEKADRVMVVPVAMGWSDVGSWQSVHEAAAKDAHGNSAGGGTTLIDSQGTIARSSGPRIAAIGVEDLVIVATPDAVLVTRRDSAQRVREAAAWFDAQQEDRA